MTKISLSNEQLKLLGYYLCHGFIVNTKYFIVFNKDMAEIKFLFPMLRTSRALRGSNNIYVASISDEELITIIKALLANEISEVEYFTIEEQREILKGKQIK